MSTYKHTNDLGDTLEVKYANEYSDTTYTELRITEGVDAYIILEPQDVKALRDYLNHILEVVDATKETN